MVLHIHYFLFFTILQVVSWIHYRLLTQIMLCES